MWIADKLRHLVKNHNNPTTPVTQNRDWAKYDWSKRHQIVLDYEHRAECEIVWIGDSIMHRFGGDPQYGHEPIGEKVWTRYYKNRPSLNLGFGYDRTENVLWRIEHGELDGLNPKVAVILIGTNNLTVNTPAETVDGIRAVVKNVEAKLRHAHLVLLALLPRDRPGSPLRKAVTLVNAELQSLGVCDVSQGMTDGTGELAAGVMSDGLHPTELGYELLAKNLEPTLRELLGELEPTGNIQH